MVSVSSLVLRNSLISAAKAAMVSAYSAAKAGILNLTRDIAVEVAPHDVTVNTICPGYVETSAQDYQTPEQVDAGRQRTLLSRLGTPQDIGRACVFFASDDASWITGTTLPVDGGWLTRV